MFVQLAKGRVTDSGGGGSVAFSTERWVQRFGCAGGEGRGLGSSAAARLSIAFSTERVVGNGGEG